MRSISSDNPFEDELILFNSTMNSEVSMLKIFNVGYSFEGLADQNLLCTNKNLLRALIDHISPGVVLLS